MCAGLCYDDVFTPDHTAFLQVGDRMLFKSLAGRTACHRLALARKLSRRLLLFLKHFTCIEPTWPLVKQAKAKLCHKRAFQDDVEILYWVVLVEYDHASGAVYDLEVFTNHLKFSLWEYWEVGLRDVSEEVHLFVHDTLLVPFNWFEDVFFGDTHNKTVLKGSSAVHPLALF